MAEMTGKPDLDATRCEGCKAVLPIRKTWCDVSRLGGITIESDGYWAYWCKPCGWEGEPGLPTPTPTWRTIAPELCAELDRLREGQK